MVELPHPFAILQQQKTNTVFSPTDIIAPAIEEHNLFNHAVRLSLASADSISMSDLKTLCLMNNWTKITTDTHQHVKNSGKINKRLRHYQTKTSLQIWYDAPSTYKHENAQESLLRLQIKNNIRGAISKHQKLENCTISVMLLNPFQSRC